MSNYSIGTMELLVGIGALAAVAVAIFFLFGLFRK